MPFPAFTGLQQPELPEGAPPDRSWYGTLGYGMLDLLDLLNRPIYAIAGGITGLQEGLDVGEAASRAWKGLSGQKRRTWDDILANIGVEAGWGRSITAFGLDVVTDPLTYLGVGTLTKTGRLGKLLGKKGVSKVADVGIDAQRALLKGSGIKIAAGEAVPSLKGLGREAAQMLARGEDIAPLAATIAEQVRLGQRALIAVHLPFVGPKTLVKGKSVLEGISKGMGWAARTRVGQSLKGIFTRTTGHAGLDEFMYRSGGLADIDSAVRIANDDIGVGISKSLKSLYGSLGPEDMAQVETYILKKIEPVGKHALRMAKRAGVAEELVEKKLASIVLPQHLRHLSSEADDVVRQLQKAHSLLGEAEIAKGIPLHMREYYIRHQFTPEMKVLFDSNPGLFERIIKDKAFHGSLEPLQLTAVGNIPEVNDLAKMGRWGPEVSQLPKMLETDPLKLYATRAQMSQNAIQGAGLIGAAESLSLPGKAVNPTEFSKYTKMVGPDAHMLFVHPEKGMFTAREAIDDLGRIASEAAEEAPGAVSAADRAAIDFMKKTSTEISERAPGLGLGAEDVVTKGVLDDFMRSAEGKGFKLLYVDDQLSDALLAHRKVIYNPDAMDKAFNAALKAFDTAHGFLRRTTLGLFPSWLFRNAIGNFYLQYLMGMKPWEMAEYAAKAGKIQALVRAGVDDVIEVAGRSINASDIMKQARNYGVAGTGMFGMEIPAVAGKKAQRMNPIFRFAFGANRQIEDNAKLGAWLWNLDRGMNPVDAAGQAKKFLFDYGALSKTEKSVFKRAAFFYTWARKNIPLQIETFLTRPGKLVPLSAAQIELMKRSGIDKEELPEWAQGLIPMPVSREGETITGGELSSWLPFGDLLRLVSSLRGPREGGTLAPAKGLLRELAAMATPLGKVPLEMMINRSLFTERPITQYPGETKPMFGARVPSDLAYMLEQWRPVGTVARAIATDERRSVGIPGEIFRYMSGIRGYKWDKAKIAARKEGASRRQISFLKSMYRYYDSRGSAGEAKRRELARALTALGVELPE